MPEAEKIDADVLKDRAEDYALRTVPENALLLTAGVDVQDNRFEIVTWGYGYGEEMWVVDYTVLDANPADESDWLKLDEFLSSEFECVDGEHSMPISAVGIDTGGHFTHHAYNFCRSHSSKRYHAVKGDNKSGSAIKGRSSMVDVNWRGAVIKRGVRLWTVGTDTAKDLFFGRLKVKAPGPGYVHFSKYLPDEFYAQLTAEVRTLQRTNTGEQYRWVKRGRFNEVLDATVYSMFASHAKDVHKLTPSMWRALKQKVKTRVKLTRVTVPTDVLKPVSQVRPANRHRPRGFAGWYRG
jgi:phage terminase large subunit GpA-like protein